MANLLMAMRIAKKLNRSQMTVLLYFAIHKDFTGSYMELSEKIYGNEGQYSNLRKYVMQLADMGLLAVDNDTETCIFINPDWQEILTKGE